MFLSIVFTYFKINSVIMRFKVGKGKRKIAKVKRREAKPVNSKVVSLKLLNPY